MGRNASLLSMSVALILLALGTRPLWADAPVEGLWLTDARDGVTGIVEVSRCATGYCGTVLYGLDAQGQKIMAQAGQQVIRGMVPNGPDLFEGEVIDPRNGSVYFGRLAVSGNTMVLQGCVLGGLICGSSTWTRP